MIRIDKTLLAEAGLSALAENLGNMTLRATYAALEARVGARLANGMTEQQLDEFEELYQMKDEDATLEWLTSELPDYATIVHEELRIVRERLNAAGAWIIPVCGQRPGV